MKYPIYLIIVLLLSSCVSMPEPTEQHVKMQEAASSASVACYQKAAAVEARAAAMLQNIPADQRMFLVMMSQQSENNKAMMAMATGRTYDPCSAGTNYNDVAVQLVRSQGELSQSYISAAKWLGGMGLGYLAIDSIVDGVGATLNAGGDIISGSSGSGNINHGMKTQNEVQHSSNINISDDPILTSTETNVDYGDQSSNDENIWGGDRAEDDSDNSDHSDNTDNSDSSDSSDNSSSDTTTNPITEGE